MTSKALFWLVQNESNWHILKTNLINKGIKLIEHPPDGALKNMSEFLLITDINQNDTLIETSNCYKVLLIDSKKSLTIIQKLTDYDSIFFKSDLNESFLKEFLNTIITKSEIKVNSNITQQIQIRNLKSTESELHILKQEQNLLKVEAEDMSTILNSELQKSLSLLKFILLLSKEMEINKILGQIWKDLVQIRGALNIFLIQSHDNHKYRFYYKSQGMFLYKLINLDTFSDEASFNNEQWADTITIIQKRKTESFFAFPLNKYFKNKASFKHTILLVEHQYKTEDNSLTIKFISERLPFISMAIEKSRVSDELITKNRLWENTFDGITDPLIIVDYNHNIIRSNKAFTNSSHGQSCYSSFFSSKSPCDNCPLPKNNKEQSYNLEAHSNELYLKNKIYLVNSYPLSKSHSNKYFINYYSEVSQERELLVKTLHVEKMRTLDSFADQLSSNLKKPLQAIRNTLELNLELLNCPDIIEIKKAVVRSEMVLSNLTEFAKGNPNLSITEIDPLIESTLPFYKSLSRKHKIHMHLKASGIYAKISPSLFQQVIFNLVNNACQAMINPGTVTISSSIHSLNKIHGIGIEIIDTGPGIPEHLRKNIFKSAFTTKDIKKGTGLGLKICQFIINSFHGLIEYQPRVHGSKFWIWIPEEKTDRI
jgi:nitrogen-specific signal transduction histidine kinase